VIVGKRLGLIALAPQSADAQAIAVASGAKGKVHLLPATLETTQWGWFNKRATSRAAHRFRRYPRSKR
jgi:hypothetical protein